VKKRNPFRAINQGPQYKEGRFVGGYISQQAYDHLRLLATYKESSVQKVLTEMIEDGIANQDTPESMIETLADKAYLEWIRRTAGTKKDPAKRWDYKEEVERYLRKRKLAEHFIAQIWKEVRNKLGTNE
jgi:hypothetical protein